MINSPKLRLLFHSASFLTRFQSTCAQSFCPPVFQTQPPQSQKLKKLRKRNLTKQRSVDPVSSQGIIHHELSLISQVYSTTTIPEELIAHYYYRENQTLIIENLDIIRVISTGHGIGIWPLESDPTSRMIVMVPFTTVGDVVDVKLGQHHIDYAEGQLVNLVHPSSTRDDTLIRCKHFNSCSGCQLQMLPYDEQLKFKTQVVENAYSQFGFVADSLPFADTVPSPLQYNYRSKLTPHFGSRRDKITLGFENVDGRLFDLDRCDIATDVLNKGLREDREQLDNIVRKYKKGGTVLLRDKSVDEVHAYTTDHTEIVTQQIGEYKFQFPAGEFFQNNNSILPVLLDDIKHYIDPMKHKNLVDTYCGSGFFGISLNAHFERLIGIEISKGSLQFAEKNAKLNGVTNSQFLLGSSEEIFKGLEAFDPNETVVILDPSRKGSNNDYLAQLSQFKPSLIVYVSCNVHSQARDLHYFVNDTENGGQYEICTIGGYDFFPQTKHVESLAVLKLIL